MTSATSPHDRATVLSEAVIGRLGPLRIEHPPGTFGLTPASILAASAVARHHELLHGVGLDWGTGTGCLAIVAARAPRVGRVVGTEISEPDVAVARRNAAANGVADKTSFVLADSYDPLTDAGWEVLDALRGRVDFIVANPPSSEGDDGFAYRRAVMVGARPFLRDGGRVLLSISFQYGARRVADLGAGGTGFTHEGILASTGWVPFDLERPDLLNCLERYAAEEERGGVPYTFWAGREPEGAYQDARAALGAYRRTGRSPYSMWQSHLFVYSRRGRVAELRE